MDHLAITTLAVVTVSEPPVSRRLLPGRDPLTDWFWSSGADGTLRLRTIDGRLAHPSLTPSGPDAAEPVAVSGQAMVVALTVVPEDAPGIAAPFCVAIVALVDDPTVRLTTNIVNCDPRDVYVGMTVRVVMDPASDRVSLPLFEPADGPTVALPEPPVMNPPRPLSDTRYESGAVLSGIGMSQVGRRLLRAPIELAVEATERAVADAGLTLAEIDGICTYPGTAAGGMGEGGVSAMVQRLGLRPTWHNGGMDQPGPIGAVTNALLAINAGLVRHVLVIRTVWEATFRYWSGTGQLRGGGLMGGGASGDFAWRLPFGAVRPASWLAVNASLYAAKYGELRPTLGRIAINARRNAGLNPDAVYREPLTMDEYMNARMISSPFGLFDCDVPCDGAIAVIVSARETEPDLRHTPVHVEAAGTWIGEGISWDQSTLTHEPQVLGPAAHMWTRTDLKPADVDIAELYDGFTYNCLSWIEALGFCGIGEGIDFIGDGSRIALDGDLPLNTHGGQLSAGRLHGFGGLHEAVVHLRGDAGDRQVADAEVAVVSSGGGTPGGCLLLTR